MQELNFVRFAVIRGARPSSWPRCIYGFRRRYFRRYFRRTFHPSQQRSIWEIKKCYFEIYDHFIHKPHLKIPLFSSFACTFRFYKIKIYRPKFLASWMHRHFRCIFKSENIWQRKFRWPRKGLERQARIPNFELKISIEIFWV